MRCLPIYLRCAASAAASGTRALPGGGQGSSPEPAAAGGCRPCRPAAVGTGHCPAVKLRWGLGEREAERSLPQRRRVGNADQQSAKNFADSQTLAAPIYGGQRSLPGCAAAGCGAVAPSLPTTKNLEALIYGRQIRAAPADAGGTGHCPAAAPTGVFRESRKTEEFGGFNLWPLNSCQNRRQQPAVGPADRQMRTVMSSRALPPSRARA